MKPAKNIKELKAPEVLETRMAPGVINGDSVIVSDGVLISN